MELALFVLILIALGLFALRFGVDSRPGITANGHDLAWTDPDPVRSPPPRLRHHAPPRAPRAPGWSRHPGAVARRRRARAIDDR